MLENQQDFLPQVLAELANLRASIEQQHSKLGQQQSTIEQQQLEIQGLKSSLASAASTTPDPSKATSRRKLLKRLAGAAIASVAVSSLGQASPAEAATGNSLIIGQTNLPSFVNDTTRLNNPSATTLAPSLFYVANASTVSMPPFPLAINSRAAIIGVTSGTDNSADAYKVGVAGSSDAAVGFGAGVYGYNPTGYAIRGDSTNGYGGGFNGGLAQIRLIPSSNTGKPNSGTHSVGEFYVDSGGTIFYCVSGGTPGNWIKLNRSINGLLEDVNIQQNGVTASTNGQNIFIIK